MLQPGFYNMDCMDGMREFPDGYFELAIVDPPYGGGFTEGGGCGGWFEKYKPKQNEGGYWNRFGQRFDRYKMPATQQTDSEKGKAHRNGGAYAEETGKKS